MIHDLRYALRLFARAPVFAATAVVTLALSIGANSALFSVINALLLQPLPFERAEDLYFVSSSYQGARREYSSFTDFVDWRAESRSFSQMAAIRGDAASITTPGGPEYVSVNRAGDVTQRAARELVVVAGFEREEWRNG